MNCMALRWQDDIIVVDAGLMFPEEELLGVDIVVPDISYLTENRDKVKRDRSDAWPRGPHRRPSVDPLRTECSGVRDGVHPRLLVEGKLEEHRLLDDAELIEMLPGNRFTLGPFSIMPIRVTHSLVDCVALAIHTPVGVVLHTGDFKIDLSPLDGKAFDLHGLCRPRARTAGCPGSTPRLYQRRPTAATRRARRQYVPRLDESVCAAPRRSFFSACFSSSITPHWAWRWNWRIITVVRWRLSAVRSITQRR